MTVFEQTGAILATAAPKGVVMVRDEIAGWLMGMEAYNPAGRAFWLEAYGGRPYRVRAAQARRMKPIEIERLAVAVYVAARNLNGCIRAGDRKPLTTGCFPRILWLWPNPVPFRRGRDDAECRFGRSRRSIACASSVPGTGQISPEVQS